MNQKMLITVAVVVIVTLMLRDKLTGLPGVNKIPTV